jgi:ATP-binding cassette subfamily F protein uup
MLQPADLLLLDEPTNDLDIPTLETLEESLLEYPGAVVLITHDRYMLDRICNGLFALGDAQKVVLYADYAQWEKDQSAPPAPKAPAKKEEPPRSKGKLSYMEKKEYEEMEGKISQLEEEVKKLNHTLEKPEVAEDSAKLSEICTAIGLAENKIEQLYLRWEELEKKQR